MKVNGIGEMCDCDRSFFNLIEEGKTIISQSDLTKEQNDPTTSITECFGERRNKNNVF